MPPSAEPDTTTAADDAIDTLTEVHEALDAREGLGHIAEDLAEIEQVTRAMSAISLETQAALLEEIRDEIRGARQALHRQAAATEVLARAMVEVVERARQVQGG